MEGPPSPGLSCPFLLPTGSVPKGLHRELTSFSLAQLSLFLLFLWLQENLS